MHSENKPESYHNSQTSAPAEAAKNRANLIREHTVDVMAIQFGRSVWLVHKFQGGRRIRANRHSFREIAWLLPSDNRGSAPANYSEDARKNVCRVLPRNPAIPRQRVEPQRVPRWLHTSPFGIQEYPLYTGESTDEGFLSRLPSEECRRR